MLSASFIYTLPGFVQDNVLPVTVLSNSTAYYACGRNLIFQTISSTASRTCVQFIQVRQDHQIVHFSVKSLYCDIVRSQ